MESSSGSAIAAPAPRKKVRRLIVGYHSTGKPGVDLPYLRICGRWLQDAGFVVGRYVNVEVDEGRLVIEQID